jgi:hypothetical protein
MPAWTRREFLRLSVLSALGMSAPLLLSAIPSKNAAAGRAAAGTKTATPLPPATKSMLGLFALMNPNDDQISDDVLTSSAISGVTLQINWSTLHPSPTVVAWTVIEGALRRVADAGKKLALRPLAGVGSPAWLYSKPFGVKKNTFTPDSDRYHPLEYGKAISMPLPWDSVMLEQWAKFVGALGQRFDGEPAFVRIAVSGPIFQRAETYLPHSDTVLADWVKAGYSLTNIDAVWEKALDAYGSAFRKTPFTLDLNPMPDSVDKSGLTLNGLVPTAIALYGLNRFPGRFFPAQSDFSDVYPYLPPPLPGPVKPPALYESYEKQAATIYTFLAGTQKKWPIGLTVSPSRVSRNSDHVQAVLARAMSLNAGYLEIPGTWASDPNNAEALKGWSPSVPFVATAQATKAR